MVAINPVPLACCKFELEKQGLVPPSDQDLAKVLETDEALVTQLNQYYIGSGEEGLDTFERDWVKEVIALHFTGCNWPCNMDNQQTTKTFAELLVKNSKAAGWR